MSSKKSNIKKVAIIGTNGIPAKYGGFETLADNLTEKLQGKFDFTVYCSLKNSDKIEECKKAKLVYLPFKANGYQGVIYDVISTIHAWFTADILLILGPIAGFLIPLNKLIKKHVIINYGGLNEWEREKYTNFQRKYIRWNIGLASKYATHNIADNEPLKKSLTKSFNASSTVIAYGGDHITKCSNSKELIRFYPFLKFDYDLSISRAQVDNNLHILLEAYTKLPNRNLVLISNWQVSKYGRDLKEQYKRKYKNIFVVDAIYDLDILNIIRSNTKLYIHSHSYCGTSPSLVEAMNYQIPIICFDAETNRLTTENKSLYFSTEGELIQTLAQISEEELEELKTELYNIGINKYNWTRIADKYSELFVS